MTRRLAIASAFALLGIPSLLVLHHLYGWFCAAFASICAPYRGPCPELDACAYDLGRGLMIGLFFLGPLAVFGIVAFHFSARPRGPTYWGLLAIGLVLTHSLVAILFFQVRNRLL